MDRKIRIFNSVFIIFIFSVLNFIFSILLQVFLASLFGTKIEMDAYVVAMIVPMIISNQIISFEVVIVPTLKNYSIKQDNGKLNNLISIIFNLLGLVLLLISILGILFAKKLIPLFVPGFSASAKELVRVLFCIMLPSIIFSGLSAFLKSVYYFEEKYTLPSLAPVVNIAVIIITALVLNSAMGIRSIAWGVLFASIFQFLILFPHLLFKRQYSFILDIKHKELIKIGKKLSYLGIGSVFLGLILILEKFFASWLPEGSIAILGYAGKFASLIVMLPSTAIPTIFLPQLSTCYALNDINKLRYLLSQAIRMTFLCILPPIVLLAVFRVPFVELLLQRGAFDAAAVNNTALAMVCYLGLFFAMAVGRVVAIGYFAVHETRIPSLLMVITFLLYIFLAPLFSFLFSFKGLAFAFSSACVISLIGDIWFLRKLLNGIDGSRMLNSFFKIGFCSLIMGLTAFLIFKNLPAFSLKGGNFVLALRMVVSILIGFFAFNVICFALRVDELRLAYELTTLRIKKLF